MRPGALEGEIEGGANFCDRELCVEEERMRDGGRRRGISERVLKEGCQPHWRHAIHYDKC
jgi:hypothetical protein